MARLVVVSIVVVLAAVSFYALVEQLAVIEPGVRHYPELPTLEPNNKLVNAKHLFVGEWFAPEAFTLDPAKKLIYSGLGDGRIVRWDGKSLNFEVFVRTGDALPNCGTHDLEHLCGRPLGLHFNSTGHLFVADAVKGVLSIDPQGRITTLVTSVEGAPLRFTNDLAIADDGTIYFTDSSIYHRRDFMLEFLEAGFRGRLMAYYPSNGTAKVLLKDLCFPNGMTWHEDKKSILFSELNNYRIVRYYVADGKTEVFADNLFGTPDNIRQREVNGKVTYLVGLGVKRSAPFSILQLAGPLPFVRALLSLLPANLVLGTIPPYGLIAELDANGKVIDSYQDPTGRTSLLSEAIEWNGHFYLGSILNNYLGRIATPTEHGIQWK